MLTCLLDKSIARRILEGLCNLENLTPDERLALDLWRWLHIKRTRMFVPGGVINILRRFSHITQVRIFLDQVEPLWPTKYVKRWARRLRQYGFTREDALTLSLATYGTDYESKSLGVAFLITLDEALIKNFVTHKRELQDRLTSMKVYLAPPYNRARLPEVVHPIEVLNFLKGEDL